MYIAVVDENGKVTIIGVGTAVITVSATDVYVKYNDGSVEYTLTVSKKSVTIPD